MSAATRICSTLIDGMKRNVTELVEEAPDPGAGAVARFVRENLRRVKDASMLVVSGTLLRSQAMVLCGVCQSGGGSARAGRDRFTPAALVNVLAERPLWPTHGPRAGDDAGERFGSERLILHGMKALAERGARNVFVTQGGKAAYLWTVRGAWRFAPPKIACHANPIGSGDCTTAGVAHALLAGKSLREAVRFGLACGSANVETLTPADLNIARVRALLRGVGVEAVAP
jgi:fructose-1-phosphate kinase PfkB-like protein